jgi:hypothetical protein
MEGVQGPSNAIGDLGLAGFEVFDAGLGGGECGSYGIALNFYGFQACFQCLAGVLGWARLFDARRHFGRFADVLLALTPSHWRCLNETIRLVEIVRRWRAGLNLKHSSFHEEMA